MKYKIWWLVALGVALMGVGMLGARAALNAGMESVPPGMDQVTVTASQQALSSGLTLTPDDVTAVQAAVKGSKLAWWSEGRGAIGTDARNTQADVYAVSSSFQDFHHMAMLYGSFLPRSGAGATAAVLDSNLAYRLFGTYNAVGLEVQYQGYTYQVCGVVRADSSVLGLVSGASQFRAYVSGESLASLKKITLAGVEAQLPADAPGQDVTTIKSAMQAQGVSTGSFLFEDNTEKIKLAWELAALPSALLGIIAVFVLLAALVRAFRGAWRESAVDLRGDYFSHVLPGIAWRLFRLLLLAAASAGLVWLILALSGLKFFLPSRFVPGSWIDTTFYTNLIQSESQTAMTAAAYPRYWWFIVWTAASRIGVWLSALAYAGMLLTALSLRALHADRKAAAAREPLTKRPGAWDVPVLWLLCLVSYGIYTLLAVAVLGLPFYPASSAFYALALGLGVWAAAMHKEKIDSLFFRKVEPSAPPGGDIPLS